MIQQVSILVSHITFFDLEYRQCLLTIPTPAERFAFHEKKRIKSKNVVYDKGQMFEVIYQIILEFSAA